MTRSTPPGRKPGQSLPYAADLSPEDFERLCSDLLAVQDGVVDADLYGLPRRNEKGLDVLAVRGDGTRIGLQAKRYKSFRNGFLMSWTDEFLSFAEHWREQKVDTFVLAVTVDLRSPARRAEIEACRARCREQGFDFQMWHLRLLDRLVRGQPEIVRDYFGDAWEVAFCGRLGTTPVGSELQIRLQLQDDHLGEDVAALVKAYEEGDESRVSTLLERMDGRVRTMLRRKDRQAVLRIECLRALARHDEAAVDAVLNDPLLADEQDLACIRSLTFDRETVDDALTNHPDASPPVRAQLLLASGRPADAAEALPDPRSPLELAVRARAEMAMGNRRLALEFAGEAGTSCTTTVFGTQLAVRFGSCLATGYDRDPGNAVPHPPPYGMLREDADASAVLEGMFKDVGRGWSVTGDGARRFDRAGWEVAILCCLPGRASEASGVLADEFARPVPSASAMIWGLTHGLPFDAARAVDAFRSCLREGRGGPEHLLVTIALLEAEGKVEDARTILDRYSSRFRCVRGFGVQKRYWSDRLRGRRAEDEFEKLLYLASGDGDWERCTRHVADGLAAGLPLARAELLRLCGMLVSREAWESLEPLLADLEKIDSRQGMIVAAHAYAGLGRPSDVLRTTEKARAAGMPPHRELVHLRADALEAFGRSAEAIAVRRSLPSPTQLDRTALAAALLRAGKVPEAARILDEVKADVPTEFRIPAAAAIRPFRPDVSRSLLEPLLEDGNVPDEQLGSFLDLAGRLGVRERADFAFRRMAAVESPDVLRLKGIEDLLAFVEDRRRRLDELAASHLQGSLPLALFCGAMNGTVAERLLADRLRPVATRHGSRIPRHSVLDRKDAVPEGCRPFPKALSPEIVLDHAALLLVFRFALLEPLVARSARVMIPPALPTAIVEELSALDQGTDDKDRAFVAILEAANRVEELSADVVAVVAHVGFDQDEDDPVVDASVVADRTAGGSADAAARARVPLLLSDEAFFELGRRGVLSTLLDESEVFVREGFSARLRVVQEHRKEMRRMCEQLKELSRYVDAALADGRMTMLELAGAAGKGEGPGGWSIRSTLHILSAANLPSGAAILSGDRFLNGYGRVGNATILDIETVVVLLKSEGVIDEARGREIRHAMREAGHQFMSDPAPDATHAASRRDFGTKGSTSTERFAAIRRNMSEAVELSGHLRIDGSTGLDGQGSEAPIVRDATLTALDVVRAAWTDRNISPERAARISDAAIDDLLFLRVPGNGVERSDAGARFWADQTYGMLLATVFVVATHDHARIGPFLTWFEERFGFDPLLDDADTAIRACEAGLRSLVEYLDSDERPLSPTTDRLLVALANRTCLALPVAASRRFDQTLLTRVGIRRPSNIHVYGRTLATDDLRTALRAPDGPRTVWTAEGETLRLTRSVRGGFVLENDSERFVFGDPDFDLLALDASDTPAEAIARVPWLGTTEEAQRVLEGLRTNASPSGLATASERTYGSVLARLARTNVPDDGLGKQEFHPPGPDVVFAALGMKPDDDVSVLDSPPRTSDVTDAETILRRRLHLPRRFDADIFREAGLSPEATRSLLESASGAVGRRMAGLISERPGSCRIDIRSGDMDLAAAAVRWTLRRLERDIRWRNVPPSLQLVAAWFHAGEIQRILETDAIDPEARQRHAAVFDAWDPPSLAHAIGRPNFLEVDVCGKLVEGIAVTFAFALLDPDQTVLDDFLDGLAHGTTAFLAETMCMPDLSGSIVSWSRGRTSTRLKASMSLLIPSCVEKWREHAIADLASVPTLEGWNTVLRVSRRGAEGAVCERLLQCWRELDYPARCGKDRGWIEAGRLLVIAFGSRLQVADHLGLLEGCRRVLMSTPETAQDSDVFEFKAAIAVHAAHLDDEEWERVADELAISLGEQASAWRRSLADAIFDGSVHRPDRVAYLLRRLRAMR